LLLLLLFNSNTDYTAAHSVRYR